MARYLGVLLVLLVPALGRAQDAPEDLLPAGTQVYLRWDGIDAHRGAYEKTALGKMLQGDSGKFLTNLVSQVQDNLGALLTVEKLLQGASPSKLAKLQADAREAPKLLGQLGQHGLILAGEVRKLEPPDAQLTLILPQAGAQAGPLFGTLRLLAGVSGVEVTESKIDGLPVLHLEVESVHVAAWVAGKHLVVTAGTNAPQAVLKRHSGKEASLAGHPLFKRVQSFNQFETSARAFVDVAALFKVSQTRGKDIAQVLEDLGMDGLRSATLYSGFDGDAERGLIEMETTGSGKGLLRLVSGKPFRLEDAPPLPLDVTSWSMTNFDSPVFYDLALGTARKVLKIVLPDVAATLPDLGKLADNALGIDLRNELLTALDDKVVLYNSPAEGPLNLGQTFLVKVKDAEKLQSALTKAIKGVSRQLGIDISIKKKTYRGVELREVHVRQPGFFFMPTFAIHKGWLAVSYFPQPIQGFVLRAQGELPVWKPDARVRESLDKLPKEFISVAVTDPRPTVKQLLSLGPLVGAVIKSFFPDTKFEVGTVPNGHEATRYLFANVSVVSQKDNVLRMETRSSLELPFDLGGVDNYAILALFALAGNFF